ncbi:hypothetical protein ABZV23_01950 [Streptomyces hirsutus]
MTRRPFRRLRETSPAAATGMGTATTLRRHFDRALGVPPDTYRRIFRSSRSGGEHDSGEHFGSAPR